VFHVYELLEDAAVSGSLQLGRLMLQHRVGLIPIQNKGNNSSLEQGAIPCHDVVEDDEPSLLVEETVGLLRDRTNKYERCNVLYRGFRNMVGCPVHAYLTTSPETITTSVSSNTLPSSSRDDEEFKFHLGVNDGQANNNFHDWNSTTKFQNTFVGQTYVFRLASHPSVVMDAYTIAPTRVVDCPGHQEDSNPPLPLRARPVSSVSVSDAVVMPLVGSATNTSGATIIDTVKDKMFTLLALPKNVTISLSISQSSHYYECYANSDCRPISTSAKPRSNDVHRATTTAL
jgi:hypothetical protein